MRAFAFCLTQNRSEADDLVYSSLIEIWSKHAGKIGADLKVSAFTIVHDQFYRGGRTGLLYDLCFGQKALQMSAVDNFTTRFSQLPRTEREALSLIGFWGFDLEYAAEICRCDPKTMERRVAMACLNLDGRPAQPRRSPLDSHRWRRADICSASAN
jgi:DNA-directed RNA polymerase specialized sigma subunit, sigma24 homolog